MIILGAGLSGLIAATQFPMAKIIEANGPESLSHKAVLRFRTDALSRLTGIPFRQVTVRKSIWMDGAHCAPSIALANQYSLKTNGNYLNRSIWNLEAAERYIAPEDLQQQLLAIIGDRIEWNRKVGGEELDAYTELADEVIISTIPMPVMMRMIGLMSYPVEFKHKQIVVDRYRVRNADIFQTIYYPDPSISTYRVSITGDLMIRERTGGICDYTMESICESFGIKEDDLEVIEESHTQRYGKIAPINDWTRREIIYKMSIDRGIYSLGRFATWRNILLDDLVKDIAMIKRMVLMGKYGATLLHSSNNS